MFWFVLVCIIFVNFCKNCNDDVIDSITKYAYNENGTYTTTECFSNTIGFLPSEERGYQTILEPASAESEISYYDKNDERLSKEEYDKLNQKPGEEKNKVNQKIIQLDKKSI